MSAAYYTKGMEIWKSPVKTENGDGTTSISMGFQCATATEIVGEEGAQAIAEMLTITADSADLTTEASARNAALEAENERLRKALKGCKTHIAGFHLRGLDQAPAVLSELNSELQRIHRLACAALEPRT